MRGGLRVGRGEDTNVGRKERRRKGIRGNGVSE